MTRAARRRPRRRRRNRDRPRTRRSARLSSRRSAAGPGRSRARRGAAHGRRRDVRIAGPGPSSRRGSPRGPDGAGYDVLAHECARGLAEVGAEVVLARRLEADQPARARRDPDRAAAVVGVSNQHHPQPRRPPNPRSSRPWSGSCPTGFDSARAPPARSSAGSRAPACSSSRSSRGRRPATVRRASCFAAPPTEVAKMLDASWYGSPARAPRSLCSIGTPRNGPSGSRTPAHGRDRTADG